MCDRSSEPRRWITSSLQAELQVEPQSLLRLSRHHHPAGVSREAGNGGARVERRRPPGAVAVIHVSHVRPRHGSGVVHVGSARRGAVGEHGGRRGAAGRGEDAAVGHVELLALGATGHGSGARGAEVDPARGRPGAVAAMAMAAEEVGRLCEGGHHRVMARTAGHGHARVQSAATAARDDAASGSGSGLQLGALELLPLLLVRVLVSPERLRVGELAAAVLALVPPPGCRFSPAASRRGRRCRGRRGRGRVRTPGTASASAERPVLVVWLGGLGLIHLIVLLLLGGEVEAEEL